MNLNRLSFLVIFFMINLSVNSVYAEKNLAPNSKNEKTLIALENKKNEVLNSKKSTIIHEALDGVFLTQKAYEALDADRPEQSQKIIISALKQINAAIVNNKELEFVPIKADVQVLMGVFDLEGATLLKDEALTELNNGNVQTARALLTPLVDEIDIEVASIPIELYKTKLTEALGYLKNNKKWEARNSMREALELFVLDTDIIPIPLVEAEILIDESTSLESSNLTQSLKLLEEAQKDLELNAVLGYENTKDNVLWNQIQQEGKKIGHAQHIQMKEALKKKISTLEKRFENGTNDLEKKAFSVIQKIKTHLSFKS